MGGLTNEPANQKHMQIRQTIIFKKECFYDSSLTRKYMSYKLLIHS
jgi:hypothetical protein